MKNVKNTKRARRYFIADFYTTPEEIAQRKKEIDRQMQETLKYIKAGKIYADIKSVYRSGMSRRITFYYVKNGAIIRATPQIAWLAGDIIPGKYDQGGKELITYGLNVGGCGMDMIFNTLYRCLPSCEQAAHWSQNYNRL